MAAISVTDLDALRGRELAAFAVNGNRIVISRRSATSSTRLATRARIRDARSQTANSTAQPSPARATEASST